MRGKIDFAPQMTSFSFVSDILKKYFVLDQTGVALEAKTQSTDDPRKDQVPTIVKEIADRFFNSSDVT